MTKEIQRKIKCYVSGLPRFPASCGKGISSSTGTQNSRVSIVVACARLSDSIVGTYQNEQSENVTFHHHLGAWNRLASLLRNRKCLAIVMCVLSIFSRVRAIPASYSPAFVLSIEN